MKIKFIRKLVRRNWLNYFFQKFLEDLNIHKANRNLNLAKQTWVNNKKFQSKHRLIFCDWHRSVFISIFWWLLHPSTPATRIKIFLWCWNIEIALIIAKRAFKVCKFQLFASFFKVWSFRYSPVSYIKIVLLKWFICYRLSRNIVRPQGELFSNAKIRS